MRRQTDLSDIVAQLRAAGLKATGPRAAVLAYLTAAHMHPTAEQVYIALKRRAGGAARATVYNTLHALRAAGLVQELYLDDAVARYDANRDRHHHFVCRLCARLEDVPAAALPGALPQVRLARGYRTEQFEIVLRGVCAACSARRTPRK